MLQVGDLAPDFSVLSDAEQEIKLSDFKGQKVVLYFYPKDDTPGCTIESCDFKESLSTFNQLNCVVLGVSRDDVKSHQKFKTKYHLNFPLLADTEEVLCKAYNVLVEKNMYGKIMEGIERSTFLINEEGKISHIWRPVKVEGHIEEILKTINN